MSFPSTHIDWAVEVAVRLMSSYDVVGEDVVTAFEVGDGAGDFQDAVIGSCGHVHAVHGVAEFFQFTSTDRMNSGSSMTEYS